MNNTLLPANAKKNYFLLEREVVVKPVH